MMPDGPVEEAMSTARAVVTSVLVDEPLMAIETLSECPAGLRMNVTLALAAMVAASMETIASLSDDGQTAEEAWSLAILSLLSANPDV